MHSFHPPTPATWFYTCFYSTSITDNLLHSEVHLMLTSVRVSSNSFDIVDVLKVTNCARLSHRLEPDDIWRVLFRIAGPGLLLPHLHLFPLSNSRVKFPSQWETSNIVPHQKGFFAWLCRLSLYLHHLNSNQAYEKSCWRTTTGKRSYCTHFYQHFTVRVSGDPSSLACQIDILNLVIRMPIPSGRCSQ